MIYKYASQDDVDDAVLSLSHDVAERIPFLLRGSVEIM
jgi:hypothetical protein